jgi:hypothetical protein
LDYDWTTVLVVWVGVLILAGRLTAHTKLLELLAQRLSLNVRFENVRGDVHTNSIENAWSLFKRSIVGSYHKVSAKHLDAYLDEFEWRFNNRKTPYLFCDTILKLIASSNLEYKKLTAA